MGAMGWPCLEGVVEGWDKGVCDSDRSQGTVRINKVAQGVQAERVVTSFTRTAVSQPLAETKSQKQKRGEAAGEPTIPLRHP